LKRNPINRHLARDFYTQITALCRRKVWRKNELYSNLSGKHFNYLDIQQDAIEIEDIAMPSRTSAALPATCQSSIASGSTAF
jgi:hypothetical protein